jgi:putative ABC transport system substrate-binding protein
LTAWSSRTASDFAQDGLRALGYRDHEHYFLGLRFTQGDTAALAAAAHKLVQDGAELLFADADDSAKAAQMATTRVPIVFASVADPLGTGLVYSFASPGGNITGVADLGLELSPKRLEIFREVIPTCSASCTCTMTDTYPGLLSSCTTMPPEPSA